MKIISPALLHVSLSPGTCSCLDVWPRAMAVSSPWQILSLQELSGSLARLLIGQLSTRGPLIGWCRPHLMSLLLAIGHTGTIITSCHQLSAYWNVEHITRYGSIQVMGLYRWRQLAVKQIYFLFYCLLSIMLKNDEYILRSEEKNKVKNGGITPPVYFIIGVCHAMPGIQVMWGQGGWYEGGGGDGGLGPHVINTHCHS